MNISTATFNDINLVAIQGDIDANTAPLVQQTILPLVHANSKLLLDLTAVPYMSSAGLRALLTLYRQVSAQQAQLVLVGLSDEIKDTMSVTGFLDFFTTRSSQEAGLAALR